MATCLENFDEDEYFWFSEGYGVTFGDALRHCLDDRHSI